MPRTASRPSPAAAQIQTPVLASIIVRTKNEQAWIARCLAAVLNQDVSGVEVLVVDTGSTDQTLAICRDFNVRVHAYQGPYTPGRALNAGFAQSRGRYLVCLSAHCIPLNDKWLERLIAGFHDPSVAAVYGRQEPLPDSHESDKRDLWTVFGIEQRLQRKDYLFHNANSAIRRDLWQRWPFDETLPSLEDRAWAKRMIAQGHAILYEPQASVYHFHGISHNEQAGRAQRVVKVIELLKSRGGA